MVLDKKKALFDRDEKGELIAKEVEVIVDTNDAEQMELDGEKIFITPMLRGEIRKMFSELARKKKDSDADMDGKLIVDHCIEPSFTEEEVKFLKPAHASVIVNTILGYSGLDVEGKKRRRAIREAEDEFGKN